MLAEDHGIVTWSFGVEDGVAMVVVAEATSEIKLSLDLAQIAIVVRVLIGAIGRTEKVRADVFDRVEAEAVCLSAINEPANGSTEIVFDPLFVDAGVILQV